MGIYAEWLFPRLLDLVMRQKQIMPFRDRLGKAAAGCVLDVGIGSGVNLPYYGDAVKHLCGVDPSPRVAHRCERACNAPVPVEFVCSGAEALPLDSKSIDSIALTFTLCTIGDPRAALVEMRRVA
jgi:ubiquinone/menaquinone biosynthesis C-methylase UbiE